MPTAAREAEVSDLAVSAPNLLSQRLLQVMKWARTGSLAVLDQSIYSGANFAYNILLARWLEPTAYGEFSLGFSVVLFLFGFYSALILEPMSVLGPAMYQQHPHSYYRIQGGFHLLITLMLGSAGLIIGVPMLWNGQGIWGGALLQAGLILPLVLLPYLARRPGYVDQQMGSAVSVSAKYAAVLLGGALVLHRLGYLRSSNTALWLMAVASLSGSIGFVYQLTRARQKECLDKLDWQRVSREQWRFARWPAMAAIVGGLSTQIQVWAIAGMIGAEAAGAYRAALNYVLPMALATTSLSTLALSRLSASFGRGDLPGLRRKAIAFSLLLTVPALCYVLILWLAGGEASDWLYARKYQEYDWMIPWVGMVAVIHALGTGASVMLRAMQKVNYYWISVSVAGPVSIIATLTLTTWSGLAGAVISLLISQVCNLFISFYLCWRWCPR
jgi:O-antigen/teichoic acid export membrane protein